jgi:hypothetical protein
MRLRRVGAQTCSTGRQLSTRTQAPPAAKPHAGGMLWSDPEDEPPKELRDMQDMLRRLGVLMALAMVLAMIVIGLR